MTALDPGDPMQLHVCALPRAVPDAIVICDTCNAAWWAEPVHGLYRIIGQWRRVHWLNLRARRLARREGRRIRFTGRASYTEPLPPVPRGGGSGS